MILCQYVVHHLLSEIVADEMQGSAQITGMKEGRKSGCDGNVPKSKLSQT